MCQRHSCVSALDREHLERLLADPDARARLLEVLQELESERPHKRIWRRAVPMLASIGAAAVTALAFLIPSLEDQWDRWKARSVVDAYATIGHKLMDEQRFAEAAGAFEKATELSDNQRIDLEEQRLRAHTSEVLSDTGWRAANPSGLDEQSFVILEQLEIDHADAKTRADTLTHHALFLVSEGRDHRAEQMFRAAIALDPQAVDARVNLANLLSDGERLREAEAQYRKALGIDPENIDARYNLGLLLEDANRLPEALAELRRSVELASDDGDALEALARVLERTGQPAAASDARSRAARLDAEGPMPSVTDDEG
jgi:tetratricopeptide (TPR) repeat protein